MAVSTKTGVTMDSDVPVKRYSKGHVIPRNGDYVAGPDGKPLLVTRPMLACEICAKAAGGRMATPSRPLRYGVRPKFQENFLDGDFPTIRIK